MLMAMVMIWLAFNVLWFAFVSQSQMPFGFAPVSERLQYLGTRARE